MLLKISEKFSDSPGGRYENEGPFSGERFRDEILIPMLEEAIEKEEKILIDLDDLYGLPTSFLEEAFGGLIRKGYSRTIKQSISFKSEDRPNIVEKIIKYIDEGGE